MNCSPILKTGMIPSQSLQALTFARTVVVCASSLRVKSNWNAYKNQSVSQPILLAYDIKMYLTITSSKDYNHNFDGEMRTKTERFKTASCCSIKLDHTIILKILKARILIS